MDIQFIAQFLTQVRFHILFVCIKYYVRDFPVVQWIHASTAGGSSIPGQGTKIPHATSQASLVAQLVKNPPAMQDTPVQFLGQKDPLEKG